MSKNELSYQELLEKVSVLEHELKKIRKNRNLSETIGKSVHTSKTKKLRVALEELKNRNYEVEVINNELQKNKEQLEEQKTYLNNILQSSTNMAIVATDLLLNVVFFNPVAEKFLGYSSEEVIGKNIMLISSKEKIDVPRIERAIDIVKNTGEYNFSYSKKIQNRKFYFKARVSGVWDTTGEIKGFVMILQDVTETVLSKRKLIESEKRYRALFYDNHSIMMLINPEYGDIIDANQSACDFYGYTHKDFTSLNIKDINILSDELIEESMQNTINNKKNHFYFKHKLSNGEIRNVEIYSGIVYFGEKKLLYSIVHDITERKKVENEIKEKTIELYAAKEKAEMSDRLKTAFLTNMSHEVRTPMNGILGFSQLINNPELTYEKRQEFANIIIDSGQQLLYIVDDILRISKIETGNMDTNEENFNLNKIIYDLYLSFKHKADAKNIILSVNSKISDSKSKIRTDSDKLKQILINLIDNAIKFTDKGLVEIGYFIKNEFIEFFVKDTGIGVEPDIKNKIFTHFYQAEAGETRNYGGTGIGLSISKAYVELLNGEIRVESVPGKGSKFIFTIPYKPVVYNFNNKITVDSAKKTKNVLIAEDEDINYTFIKELLDNQDFIINRAENGKEAVDFCKENKPDLILMDIKMPIMNGLDATREIKKIHPQIPIIVQTAYAMSEDKEKAFEAGCDDYISKPFEQEEFMNLIHKYFNYVKVDA